MQKQFISIYNGSIGKYENKILKFIGYLDASTGFIPQLTSNSAPSPWVLSSANDDTQPDLDETYMMFTDQVFGWSSYYSSPGDVKYGKMEYDKNVTMWKWVVTMRWDYYPPDPDQVGAPILILYDNDDHKIDEIQLTTDTAGVDISIEREIIYKTSGFKFSLENNSASDNYQSVFYTAQVYIIT